MIRALAAARRSRLGITIGWFVVGVVSAGLATGVEAQVFTVATFRPWRGYAIPNGLWLTGDFNNDNRADVFHAVASGDYAHIWTSDGNGGFAVSTFRPWPGYAIPNGMWLAGDYNNDGRQDVFHAVASGDYAHVWTSAGGAGNFTVSTFRPWPGYAIPNGVWLTGDFNNDGRQDVFHAVASGDYAHIWTSSGGPGGFTVSTFRPWPGYAIPNGVWLTGDFNNDSRTDVFHAVASGGYSHVWLSNGAGSFTVATFRPWNGYAIPNGVWRTGDFDGDGRTDVLHAVASGGYAHVWRSLGNGAFNVSTFQPWPGYAIPNGEWLTGDVDDDGATDVVHAVANSNYAHIWRSRGDGTFTVGTFSPWNGYAIPNGRWLGADLTGDGKMDVFHAVASGDYAHPWLSNWPRANEVTVVGVEVTQAIQDMAHTVTLVASKQTVARVYLMGGPTAPGVVSGRLRVRNATTSATVSAQPAQQR